VFLCYEDKDFDYRLWDSEKRKIVRSREVIFHEHETIANIDRSKKITQYPTGVVDVTLVSHLDVPHMRAPY